jgi:hypothetical protein
MVTAGQLLAYDQAQMIDFIQAHQNDKGEILVEDLEGIIELPTALKQQLSAKIMRGNPDARNMFTTNIDEK